MEQCKQVLVQCALLLIMFAHCTYIKLLSRHSLLLTLRDVDVFLVVMSFVCLFLFVCHQSIVVGHWLRFVLADGAYSCHP